MLLPMPHTAKHSLVPATSSPSGPILDSPAPISSEKAILTANGVVTAIVLLLVVARFFANAYYVQSQIGWKDVRLQDLHLQEFLALFVYSLLRCWNGQSGPETRS